MSDIVDCAIFGAPHPEFGEMVVAAVQCQPKKMSLLSKFMNF
ncbi:hypothetical protein [Paraglaciecola psychrophila]|nr:hypothetical protein [Paraglaciecola psychrophila]